MFIFLLGHFILFLYDEGHFCNLIELKVADIWQSAKLWRPLLGNLLLRNLELVWI